MKCGAEGVAGARPVVELADLVEPIDELIIGGQEPAGITIRPDLASRRSVEQAKSSFRRSRSFRGPDFIAEKAGFYREPEHLWRPRIPVSSSLGIR